MSKLRLVGYWKSDREPDLPDPADFVDPSWDPVERALVASYLSSGTIPWASCCHSPCRICGQPNGSVEFTDGVLLWPEGLAHYIEDHGVRLPAPVVEHCLARCADYEPPRVEIDRAWWRTITREHG